MTIDVLLHELLHLQDDDVEVFIVQQYDMMQYYAVVAVELKVGVLPVCSHRFSLLQATAAALSCSSIVVIYLGTFPAILDRCLFMYYYLLWLGFWTVSIMNFSHY